ncbi:tetratricopeptide repeat protein [Ostertagia ostertagi]
MDWTRAQDVMPTFTAIETDRFLSLSSLDFNNYYSNGDPRRCPERSILFKANRVLESRLDYLLSRKADATSSTNELFDVYRKLGHVAVLAQDWAKALSAYQEAYKLKPFDYWKDPGAYFGLGLVYIHFKEFKLAADSFSRLLYTFPNLDIIVEVKARLGVCYQNLSDYPKALKFYNQALSDLSETPFLSKTHIRFNMALSSENAGDLAKAEEEYKDILAELAESQNHQQDRQYTQEQTRLVAAVNRQLGWISYRFNYPEQSEERARRLREAEQFLQTSKKFEPINGKTYYYLGRCYGETLNKAHEAFLNYRHSIDKSEADADTWCSIGVLYHQQNQPMDALQAFICAVELDPEHSAAWTNLGVLYEVHAQFNDALACFRNAIKFNPAAPEPLKARIIVLEKELQTSTHFSSTRTVPPNSSFRLPCLKDAWGQPIPSELRVRQEDFLKQKHQRYRDGSAIWKMGELAAPLEGVQEVPVVSPLEKTQLQMMRLLQMNKDRINEQEKVVLDQLELRYRDCMSESTESQHIFTQTTTSFSSINEVDVKVNRQLPATANIKEEEDTKVVKYEHDASPPLGELPCTFSLLAPLLVPLDISSSELMEMCSKRIDRPAEFTPIFCEKVPPPQPPDAPCVKLSPASPGRSSALLRPTPLVVVESRKDAQAPELQRFCESSPIALIRGLTGVLKMDLSLFSTKTLLEMAPDHEVEVRTQYRMPCDMNVDHLGQPTWECMSTRSFTTVMKYAQYQAETFKHSLKEEAEKLRSAGAKYAQHVAESAGVKRRRGINGDECAMPMKMLKFGTNVDLSDDTKWKAQIQELAKMPPFCRIIAGCNMLSHLGHTVLGMNTTQLYMKVPGSRTPAHQENNCFASVNINVGPGDCEWFGCPYEYWGVVDRMCRDLIRGQLIRSLAFCKMVANLSTSRGKQLKPQPRAKGEITHYCTLCEVEVFNILFVKEINGKFPVYCVYCARRAGLDDFIVLQQLTFHDLAKIFDSMQMNLIHKAALVC